MMVSPLALSTASRKLQDAPLVKHAGPVLHVHALAMGEVGVGSLSVFTKKLGSGIGSISEGATSLACNAITPMRPSTLRRMGNAAIGVPEYGRRDTSPDWNVCAPGSPSACETSVSCPENAFNTITSSAPLMEIRVRNISGVWLAPSAAAPEKLSTIFHPV